MQSARSSYNHEEPGSRQIGITQRGLDISCAQRIVGQCAQADTYDYRVPLTWTFDR